ncbi:MAG TPA: GFA family protein [Polyangiaceae bacterium]|nr:GFA family protein [Polyangiaceae bacterium]
MSRSRTLSGGCHCGAVRFEVDVAPDASLSLCNCSICDMTGYLHLIVQKSCFRLTSGSEQLREYRFNTGTARHLFCSVCGIKSFYVPRSHPDGFSVNARCLDGLPFAGVEPQPFDGQNWEQNAGVFAER